MQRGNAQAPIAILRGKWNHARPSSAILGKFGFMRIAASVAALLALSLSLLPAGQVQAAAKKKAAKPARHHVTAAESRHAALVAAEGGDREAQYQMGLAYRDGAPGIKADPQMALVWFSLAGASGHLAAAQEAAKAYEAGKGARRDLGMAGNWWFKAGQLGDEAARDRWVGLFADGDVHAMGGAEGRAWLTQAANAGNLKAIMALADSLETGLGGAPDVAGASEWYRDAALLYGDVEARYRLGMLLLHQPAQWRKPGSEDWDPKDAASSGRPFGAVWYATKPADTDEADMVQLRRGMAEGGDWLLSAARRGYAEAQYALGMAKVVGMDLPFDIYGGIGWLEAAAAQGHAQALMALGNLAAKGQGFFAKDPVRAYVMFDLAAGQGEGGAKALRDAVAKGLNQKQMARSRQLVAELKDLAGL